MIRAVLGLLLFLLTGPVALAETKVALVIGNADYPESRLRNAVNDARAMAEKLTGLGFTVIARENADYRQMQQAIQEFGEQIADKDATALVYFAGHGLQSRGANYLVPVDAAIRGERDIPVATINLDAVLTQLEFGKAKVSLVILDACRNNPFEGMRGGGGGLAAINAPRGTLIAYATAPGSVAADGTSASGHGLYTEALLDAMSLPGMKVEDMFKRVRTQVSDASENAQVPWESSSLTGDFYFVPPLAAEGTLVAYAASPGEFAAERDGHGVFTSRLLKYLPRRNMTFTQIMSQAIREVRENKELKQTPQVESTLDGEVFLFDPVFAEKTHALVIGVENYSFGPLQATLNDARSMADFLSSTGAKVSMHLEPDLATTQAAFRTFIDEVAQAPGPASQKRAIIYVASTGVEIAGKTLFAPLDAAIDDRAAIDRTWYDISGALKELEAVSAVRLVMLDFCREDPFRDVPPVR